MKKPSKTQAHAKTLSKARQARAPRRGKKTPATPKTAPVPTADGPAHKKTRVEALTDLLRIPGGVTREQIRAEFGWVDHSVRGAISKIDGVTKIKDKARGGTVYSLPPAEPTQAAA